MIWTTEFKIWKKTLRSLYGTDPGKNLEIPRTALVSKLLATILESNSLVLFPVFL